MRRIHRQLLLSYLIGPIGFAINHFLIDSTNQATPGILIFTAACGLAFVSHMGGDGIPEHTLSSVRATVETSFRRTMEHIPATSMSSLRLRIALTIWSDEMTSSVVSMTRIHRIVPG